MLEKLPYPLSEGVTATREGLRLDDRLTEVIGAWIQDDPFVTLGWEHKEHGRLICDYWLWPDAAKVLCYRAGEPWIDWDNNAAYMMPSHTRPFAGAIARGVLYRVAALLCDEEEAFRVLNWCITELGGGV